MEKQGKYSEHDHVIASRGPQLDLLLQERTDWLLKSNQLKYLQRIYLQVWLAPRGVIFGYLASLYVTSIFEFKRGLRQQVLRDLLLFRIKRLDFKIVHCDRIVAANIPKVDVNVVMWFVGM